MRFEEVEDEVEFGETLFISLIVDFKVAEALHDFGAGAMETREGEDFLDGGFI